jgi:peptidoglycan/xylan/chitin deacetylase (PgdA/CDA1 family)
MRSLRVFLALLAALFAWPAAAQAPQGASAAKSFVIYVSPASRRFLEKEGPDLKARVNVWRDMIAARGEPYTIVTHPAQLARTPAASAIVLPSAVVLSDEERGLIERRIAAGEGLLATWMPGTLDANGAPLPPAFVQQAFKVSAKPANPGEKFFMITVGDTPLTYSIPAGTRLWAGKDRKFPTPYLETVGAGYLSDWSRATDKTGLVAFTTVGASRRALLGFPEVAWDLKSADYVKLANLALDWVEGKPVAYLRSWPWPARGAVTLGADALWRFENVPRLADAMSKAGVKGSFHFLSTDAGANAAAIKDLLRAGHSVGGFGDSTQPFAGQSPGEQRGRVERMVRGFRAVLDPGVDVSGLRAPQGATDEDTEKAAASLNYLVDLGRVDSLVPALAPDHHLVLLANGANLDSNATLEAVNEGLEGAAIKAQVLGGYSFVGVDVAGYQADGPMEKGLARYLDASKSMSVWNASAADVARWWRAHEGLKVANAWDASQSTLTLDVSAAEPVPFPAAISIVPPPGTKSLRIDASPSAGAVERQDLPDGAVALVLSALPAGSHRLQVVFAR